MIITTLLLPLGHIPFNKSLAYKNVFCSRLDSLSQVYFGKRTMLQTKVGCSFS
jgi:hypothetical protein